MPRQHPSPDGKRRTDAKARKERVAALVSGWKARSGLPWQGIFLRLADHDIEMAYDPFYQGYLDIKRPLNTNHDLALAVMKVFADGPERARCRAHEAIEFLQLIGVPPDRYSEIRTLFPASEWEEALGPILRDLLEPAASTVTETSMHQRDAFEARSVDIDDKLPIPKTPEGHAFVSDFGWWLQSTWEQVMRTALSIVVWRPTPEADGAMARHRDYLCERLRDSGHEVNLSSDGIFHADVIIVWACEQSFGQALPLCGWWYSLPNVIAIMPSSRKPDISGSLHYLITGYPSNVRWYENDESELSNIREWVLNLVAVRRMVKASRERHLR
jgi:hypothetical protein